MSLARIDEMVADLTGRENSASGFTAKELYSTGGAYGVTCAEVSAAFLGKARALSRGLYPGSDPNIAAVPVKAPKPPKAAKPAKAAKVPKPAKAPKAKKAALLTEVVPPGTPLPDEDAPADWEAGVKYIATPDEIADLDLVQPDTKFDILDADLDQ